MILLAAPFHQMSCPILARNGAGIGYEVLARGCFELTGKPVRLLAGHGGRLIGRMKPWTDDRGLWFAWPEGSLPPPDMTGCSVRMKVLRYKRLGHQCFEVQSALLKHIAVMQRCRDESPAYPATRHYQIKEASL